MKQYYLLLLVATPCLAISSINPTKGQSAEQQDKDTYECDEWAKQQTGFDPAAAQAPQPPSQPRVKEAAKSAAKGAVGGPVGMGFSAKKHRSERLKEQQEQEEAKAQQQQQLESFDKARAACLEGRGYSVK